MGSGHYHAGKGPRADLRALDGRHPDQRRPDAGVVMIGRFAAAREGQRQEADGKMDGIEPEHGSP